MSFEQTAQPCDADGISAFGGLVMVIGPRILEEYPDELSADVLIVGAGMSGLQFAKDIAGEARAVVLEAGGNLGTNHIYWDSDVDSAQRQWQSPANDPSFNRPWISTTSPHYGGTSGLRQRIGGRSLYWHGMVLRMDSWALVPEWWPSAVIQDLPRLYGEQELECASGPVLEGATHLESLLRNSGFPNAQAAPLAVQYGRTANSLTRWAAYTPLTYWSDSAATLPPIVSDTQVESLLTKNGRIQGAIILNKRSQSITKVHCPSVVLAAGTIQNSRLAAEALYREDCLSSPTLTGLSDHLVSGCMFRIEVDEIPPSWPYSETASTAIVLQDSLTRSNFFAVLSSHPANKKLIFVDVWGMGEQLPQHENTVRVDLTSRVTYVSADYSAEDRITLSQQRTVAGEIASKICATLGNPIAVAPPSDNNKVGTVSDAYALVGSSPDKPVPPIWYASPLGSVDHEGCTIPFGHILSNTGEFRNIQGLYALGPCTFPRLGAANPSLTTLALAKRTAQLFH